MRSRLALALVALSLPAADLSAQIRPVVPPQTSRRPRPAEKPPQAPGIPDARLYSRYRLSRFSLEQYPMLTQLQATGMIRQGIATNYTMLGDGTHLGYRVTPSVSVTGDLTSAVLGAPLSFGSADIGIRIKPWTSPRFRPFIDGRISRAYVVPVNGVSNVVPVVFLSRSMFGEITTGDGRGATLGLGGETSLGRNWILASSLSSTRYSMTGRQLTGPRGEWKYTADALRLALGVRYNPGRWYDAPR